MPTILHTKDDAAWNLAGKHVPELDGIRGLACLSIVLLHCFVGIGEPATDSILSTLKSWTMPFLIGGVDLFFVLSGFLIGGILMDSRGKPGYFSGFWIRRIGRIFPANYLLITTYAVALVIQKKFNFPEWSIWTLQPPLHSPLWYFTYTQSIPLALEDWGPKWVGVSWSLAIEEQFYVIFPFLAYLLSRRRLVSVSVTALLASPLLFALVIWWSGEVRVGYVLLPCRMSALLLGVVVAAAVRDQRLFNLARRYRFLIDAAVLFIVFAVRENWVVKAHFALQESGWTFLSDLFHSPIEYFELSFMFALIMLRVTVSEGSLYNLVLRWRPLAALGAISYALYMYHQSINGTLHGFIFGHEPRVTTVNEALVACLVVSLAVACATVSYFVIERPTRNFARALASRLARRLGDSRASTASAAEVEASGMSTIPDR
jgi:peptidoglycan/LPS O-acetylase OafA/YrhL